jgi:hypothetical protein
MAWEEPYLETCCRAALHRLSLAGQIGRPAGLKDGPCLARLVGMGLAATRQDGRLAITCSGVSRHAGEVLKQPAPTLQAGAIGSNEVAAS